MNVNKIVLVSNASLLASLAALPPGAVVMDGRGPEDALTALRDELREITEDSEAIVAKADEEDRELSDEELETIEANAAKGEKLKKQIKARESVSTVTAAGPGRRTAAEPNNAGRPGNPATPRRNDPRGGFTSFGDFAQTVRNVQIGAVEPDQRLRAAATTYGNEGTGADGGFAVPPEFRQEIWQKVMGDESLISRTDMLTTGANSMTFPKDETTPWDTTTGVQAYWESEAGAISQSKPALEMASTRLAKLTALVPVSEELLEDAPGIDSYLRSKVPAKMQSKLNTALVRGTGVGQPLGVLNAPSLISVAKEGSQAADTILYANIVKMWNRLWGPLRRNAVWLINQDIEPQLDLMSFDPASTSLVPVYLPAGGVSASPFATLKGRPVIPVEACSTLGDKGDIMLTDLKQYMTLSKGRDIKTDVSMHLFFDQALLAFRFIFRVNGQPWWGKTISPENGTTTRSWAVTLDERA